MRSLCSLVALSLIPIAALADGGPGGSDLDKRLQSTLERALPRLACNLSATDQRKYPVLVVRDGRVQVVELAPAKGSILGAASKENPDYFFVWMRDSSLTADALVQLLSFGAGGANDERLREFLGDYVRFTEQVQNNGSQLGVNDPRCNIDGSVDLIQWSRPQRDGPALQSLALLRLLEAGHGRMSGETRSAIERIVARNLDDVSVHVRGKSYDPWEFFFGHSFYVRLVQLGALEEGQRLLGTKAEWATAAKTLETLLDGHWDDGRKTYLSALGEVTDWRGNHVAVPGGGLDMSTLLAVVHARRAQTKLSVRDPGVQSTLSELEAVFRRIYPINSDGSEGPAMGRFEGDDYYGGNPWFITTLATAEFHFRKAATSSGRERLELIRKGEAFLERVLRVIPENGMVGEQFDMSSGRPMSSHDLSWSYAALLTASLAREKALESTALRFDRVDFRCRRL